MIQVVVQFHRRHEAVIWYTASSMAIGGFLLYVLCLWGYSHFWTPGLNGWSRAFRVGAYVSFGIYLVGLIVGFPTWIKGPRHAMNLSNQ